MGISNRKGQRWNGKKLEGLSSFKGAPFCPPPYWSRVVTEAAGEYQGTRKPVQVSKPSSACGRVGGEKNEFLLWLVVMEGSAKERMYLIDKTASL